MPSPSLPPFSSRLRAHTQVLRVRRRALGVSTALIAEPFASTANAALAAATSAVRTACAPDVAPAEPTCVCGPRFRRHTDRFSDGCEMKNQVNNKLLLEG